MPWVEACCITMIANPAKFRETVSLFLFLTVYSCYSCAVSWNPTRCPRPSSVWCPARRTYRSTAASHRPVPKVRDTNNVVLRATLLKKPCRNAPNADVDNGGAEPKDVGVGIFRPPRRLVRSTVVHIGISRSFFYSVQYSTVAPHYIVDLCFTGAAGWGSQVWWKRLGFISSAIEACPQQCFSRLRFHSSISCRLGFRIAVL